MAKQTLSIEQMQHLHNIGLDTSNASMQYIENDKGKILCILIVQDFRKEHINAKR